MTWRRGKNGNPIMELPPSRNFPKDKSIGKPLFWGPGVSVYLDPPKFQLLKMGRLQPKT